MLVFTSCVNNYLPKARTLAQSLKHFHPDWTFCLLLGELPPANFNLDQEPFDRLVLFESVGPANYQSWKFRHKLVELCTAIKGFALNHFLEQEHHPKVTYLDPDILLLDSLAPLEKLLDHHDILLTPHQLSPQTTARAIQDNEICSLQHGIFNLGFLACANTSQGIAFSRFWRERLQYYCRDDKTNGLFTDQKWCDLAPAYFPGLHIVRDPGCNAASWNLTDRHIAQSSDGKFTANGAPLRFYHFTGHDSGMGKIMSRVYGAHMPAVSTLWQIYDEKLRQNTREPLQPWSGSFFSNGTPIPNDARTLYRDDAQLQNSFPDPYPTNGHDGFFGQWQKHYAKERNLLYVWLRKPFRLARLGTIYLKRNGGISALPQLLARVAHVFKNEGFKGLIDKIRKFKQNINAAQSLPALSTLLDPRISPHWAEILRNAFANSAPVLLLDHMYGGGANDYREKRIQEFLKNNRPCLLARWDFFAHFLRLDFYLPDGSTIAAAAPDLGELAKANSLHFGLILLNELVLWSTAKPGNHYLALENLANTILALKDMNGANLEIAIHDFYPVCPSYTLLEYPDRVFCNVPDDPLRCHNCLKHSPYDIPPEFNLPRWRETWQKLLKAAETIHFFSNSSRGLFAKCFTLPPDRTHIVPHEPLAPLPPITRQPQGRELVIGVIGHIAWHKGSQIVRDLAKLLGENEKLTVIGALEGDHPPNVKVLGDYRREELPKLIEQEGITVCLVPSIWPETFCYVVQEIMQMDMPLVVFPLGAQAERIANHEKGMIARDISAAAALEAIRTLGRRPTT